MIIPINNHFLQIRFLKCIAKFLFKRVKFLLNILKWRHFMVHNICRIIFIYHHLRYLFISLEILKTSLWFSFYKELINIIVWSFRFLFFCLFLINLLIWWFNLNCLLLFFILRLFLFIKYNFFMISFIISATDDIHLRHCYFWLLIQLILNYLFHFKY